ncbi:hypothetical protein [Pseudanabaena sp. PCC 6802]|uniref:hypothetical protein n=1 Tax=Pseudanabaena sp. PCC 6802 TaxID=118173 RepID=UPI00034BCA92|nr:hypothetical protein [Pseudanabaena sp. PCC 6802]
MPRDKTLRVRLNQREFDKIQLLAQQHDVPMSEVVRDLIKQLPEPLTGSLSEGSLYTSGEVSSPSLYTPVPSDLREV